jgi:hypothetical protein
MRVSEQTDAEGIPIFNEEIGLGSSDGTTCSTQ